jgi:hypothetical protein
MKEQIKACSLHYFFILYPLHFIKRYIENTFKTDLSYKGLGYASSAMPFNLSQMSRVKKTGVIGQ